MRTSRNTDETHRRSPKAPSSSTSPRGHTTEHCNPTEDRQGLRLFRNRDVSVPSRKGKKNVELLEKS